MSTGAPRTADVVFSFRGVLTGLLVTATLLATPRASAPGVSAGLDGRVGGLAIGGGIVFVNFLGTVTGTVEGSALLRNEAAGGAVGAGSRGGSAQGGGLAAGNFGTSTFPGTVAVGTTLVADNVAQGSDSSGTNNGGDGLGGGLYNDTASTMTVTAAGPTTRPTSAWPSTCGLIATTCSRSCDSRGWTRPTGGRSWPSASASSSGRSGAAAGRGPGRGRSRS
jgi:hypothetical protein